LCFELCFLFGLCFGDCWVVVVLVGRPFSTWLLAEKSLVVELGQVKMSCLSETAKTNETKIGAGGAIRARDLWTGAFGPFVLQIMSLAPWPG
jgi:hypothetical protein